MVLSAADIVLRYVCPSAGAVIALAMFGAPMPAVLAVRRRRYLGDTNALPFAAMAANCLAWIFYGFLIRDWFVYAPNYAGLMFGWFYTFTCYRFSKDAAQDALLAILLATATLFFVIGAAHFGLNLPVATAKLLWGSAAVGVLALYYTAPLSTVASVLRARDSSSLNGPLSTMNVINGALWFAYGMAVNDWFIAAPNGVGVALNVFCVLLCLIFPKKRAAADAIADLPAAAAGAGAPLRLQSSHFTPVAGDNSRGNGNGGGGFFDLLQLRWRSGRSVSVVASGSGKLRGGAGLTAGAAIPEGADLEAAVDAHGAAAAAKKAGNAKADADAAALSRIRAAAPADVDAAVTIESASSAGSAGGEAQRPSNA